MRKCAAADERISEPAWPPRALVGMDLPRITVDPAQMGGVPCIRSFRIPVATVVGMLADGMSHAEILIHYPDIVEEDIRAALRYASDAVRERELPLRRAE